MFGMSFFDVLSSVATSLTTLPMPKELPFYHPPYDGTRLGNTHTCEAQGFIFLLGFIAVFVYNVMLFVYYTCAISFQMEDKKIAKYVEPILHILPLEFGLGVAIPPLVHGLYNPIDWDAWCTMVESEDVQADETRVNIKSTNNDTLKIVTCIVLMAIIIASTILIIQKVVQVDRELRSPKMKRYSANLHKAAKSLQNNTKVIVIQVMAYLSSFMITLGIIFF